MGAAARAARPPRGRDAARVGLGRVGGKRRERSSAGGGRSEGRRAHRDEERVSPGARRRRGRTSGREGPAWGRERRAQIRGRGRARARWRRTRRGPASCRSRGATREVRDGARTANLRRDETNSGFRERFRAFFFFGFCQCASSGFQSGLDETRGAGVARLERGSHDSPDRFQSLTRKFFAQANSQRTQSKSLSSDSPSGLFTLEPRSRPARDVVLSPNRRSHALTP